MELTVVVAMGINGLVAIAFTGWWLDRLIKREMDLLHGIAIDQSRQLSVVSTELHSARIEVARMHSEVGAVRIELESFVHGPPSMKRPPLAAS